MFWGNHRILGIPGQGRGENGTVSGEASAVQLAGAWEERSRGRRVLHQRTPPGAVAGFKEGLHCAITYNSICFTGLTRVMVKTNEMHLRKGFVK